MDETNGRCSAIGETIVKSSEEAERMRGGSTVTETLGGCVGVVEMAGRCSKVALEGRRVSPNRKLNSQRKMVTTVGWVPKVPKMVERCCELQKQVEAVQKWQRLLGGAPKCRRTLGGVLKWQKSQESVLHWQWVGEVTRGRESRVVF